MSINTELKASILESMLKSLLNINDDTLQMLVNTFEKFSLYDNFNKFFTEYNKTKNFDSILISMFKAVLIKEVRNYLNYYYDNNEKITNAVINTVEKYYLKDIYLMKITEIINPYCVFVIKGYNISTKDNLLQTIYCEVHRIIVIVNRFKKSW